MKLLISPNLKMESAKAITQMVIASVAKYNMEPFLLENTANQLDLSCDLNGFQCCENMEYCDMILAVGGDGTIFHCAADALHCDKPILGINAGRLGFLSQMELSDISLLKSIAENKYSIEKRMVLEAVIKTDKGSTSFLAVNDIVFSRSNLGRIIDLGVKCNKEFVGSYRADGLIFATPTGSTAYSLSAGGPIVDPSMDCIIFTPICAHSVFDRSILFTGDKEIEVSHQFPDKNDKLIVIVDGQPILLQEEIENIVIKTSQKRTQFVCLDGKNFFSTFNNKFK